MRRVATQKRPTSEYDYQYRIKIQIVWPGLGLPHFVVKVKLSHTCGLRAFGTPQMKPNMERVKDEPKDSISIRTSVYSQLENGLKTYSTRFESVRRSLDPN